MINEELNDWEVTIHDGLDEAYWAVWYLLGGPWSNKGKWD
jgi:hypothetical protein